MSENFGNNNEPSQFQENELIEGFLSRNGGQFGEAQVCIKIARWRATEVLRQNEILEDTQTTLFDMLSIIRARIEKIQREPEGYITIRNYRSTYIPPHD